MNVAHQAGQLIQGFPVAALQSVLILYGMVIAPKGADAQHQKQGGEIADDADHGTFFHERHPSRHGFITIFSFFITNM